MAEAGLLEFAASPSSQVRLPRVGRWEICIDRLFVDRPSRISTIFYLGLEGTGGLEMETDEEEDVRPLRVSELHLFLTFLSGN